MRRVVKSCRVVQPHLTVNSIPFFMFSSIFFLKFLMPYTIFCCEFLLYYISELILT